MMRCHTRMCLLGVWMTTHNFKGLNPKKGRGYWLGIFQPNWQNYKIAISPVGKIGLTPYFDRVIEPHTWVVQNGKIPIQDGGRPPCWKYIRNAITRLSIDRLGRNLGGHIPSCPRHVRHDAVAMATAAGCLLTAHWTFCWQTRSIARPLCDSYFDVKAVLSNSATINDVICAAISKQRNMIWLVELISRPNKGRCMTFNYRWHQHHVGQ